MAGAKTETAPIDVKDVEIAEKGANDNNAPSTANEICDVKRVPEVGRTVDTPEGRGVIESRSLDDQKYKVVLENGSVYRGALETLVFVKTDITSVEELPEVTRLVKVDGGKGAKGRIVSRSLVDQKYKVQLEGKKGGFWTGPLEQLLFLKDKNQLKNLDLGAAGKGVAGMGGTGARGRGAANFLKGNAPKCGCTVM